MDSDFAGTFGRLYGMGAIPNPTTGDTKFAMRVFGIKLHKPVGSYVGIKRLPKGWRLTADRNLAGWGYIVDPLGHRRFEFCCLQDKQGEVYQAYTRATPRYSIRNFVLESSARGDWMLAYYIFDNQTGEQITGDGDWETSHRPPYGNATKEECEDYLNKHYPDWQKPLAYWIKPPRSWWRRLMSWPY